MDIIQWKKPIWKGYIHKIPTIWHSGKGKIMETVIRSEVASGSWLEEGMNRGRTEDFLSSKTFYDTVLVDICHEASVKTYRMYTTKNES